MTSITTGDEAVVRVADADPRADLLERVDGARAVAVGSTGVPAVEPLVGVTRAGRTAFHARCTPDRLEAAVDGLLADGEVTAGEPDAVVEHDPATARLPVPELPGLSTGVRTVLGACGWRRPAAPADHEAAGGFAGPDPAAVLDAGADLRGRGWGDWCRDEPVAPTWETVRAAEAPGVVVVNGHGSAADALLLASAPFEVLDGATSLADAVGADRVVVYASRDDDRAVATVREAVGAYPDPPVALDVETGPADYRAAEPTMALEALEGNHRLEARLRPPGPEAFGLGGRPTLVHTPRTVAHLAVALRGEDLPETRVLSVTGDVAAPATVELPETATVGTALDAVEVDGAFKAACVGGRFGGLAASLDVPVDPASLADAGLGTEGDVEVLAGDRCVVAFVGRRARFAAEENCGRCVPCREGTTQLAETLRAVYDGSYDPDAVTELASTMESSSICAFGVDAGRPARTALSAFESEFEAHADGDCPAGSCPEPQEVS